MIRQNCLYWIVPLIVLAMLAGGAGAAPQAAAQATAAPTTSVGTPDAALTFGPGPFDLQPAAGLADLSGYQAKLKVDFNGKDGGKASQWTETLELLANGKPAARALTATFKGKAPVATYVPPWSAAMNGVYYWRGADGACIGSVIKEGTTPDTPSMVWEPAVFLPVATGAENAGAKKVNGVAAKGYKFDELALGAAGRAKATGEVWVADPGGYVVKYNLTLKGGTDYFGEGSEGTVTWAYDVTKAGQPAAIKLLKDCPAGLVDAPVMDDAKEVQRYPGTTIYITSSTVAQVADFYKKNLPGAGWKVGDAPIIGETSSVLNFQQGTSELRVFIIAGDKGTVVRLIKALIQ